MNEQTALWLQGLRQGRAMRFLPAGGSMSPFFRGGDIVTIEPGSGCRVGEVVLRCHGYDFILHRVVAKSRDGVITKGDALSSFDFPDNSKNIWGRAVLRERQGRIRSLDTFWFRFIGMTFSLTVPMAPSFAKGFAGSLATWSQGRGDFPRRKGPGVEWGSLPAPAEKAIPRVLLQRFSGESNLSLSKVTKNESS